MRALAGRAREPLDEAERGRLLETVILHELRAHVAMADIGGELSYWRTPSGNEIDFIWTRGPRAAGIEVKASARWRSGSGDALNEMLERKTLTRGVGVFLGERRLRDGAVDVLPFGEFLAALGRGEVIG